MGFTSNYLKVGPGATSMLNGQLRVTMQFATQQTNAAAPSKEGQKEAKKAGMPTLPNTTMTLTTSHMSA